jgi:hypothetical protein
MPPTCRPSLSSCSSGPRRAQGPIRARFLGLASAALGLACSEPAREAEPSTTAVSDPAAVAVAEPSTPSTETPVIEAANELPETPPTPETPAADPSAPTQADAPAAAPSVVPSSVVTPVAFTAPWRELASPSEALSFVNLDAGVLASSASGLLELDDSGQWVVRTEIEAWPSNTDLIGEWPNNVWYIERRDGTIGADDRAEYWEELRLMRLRNGKRWVPQEYQAEQRFTDDGHDFQIGAKGGLLVTHEGKVTRVAGGTDDPVIGEFKGELLAFAETRSGRVYPITDSAGAVWVQRDCQDSDCVEQNAIQLPLGDRWNFGRQIARQRHSVTLVATARPPGQTETVDHLLHYGTGGWKLEAIAQAPDGMWPSKDGGLWAKLGAELWHRDPDGAWRNVALPAGASSVSVALRGDQNELWITGIVAGKPAVYAVHANVQDPAPAAAPTQAG